MNRRQFLLIVNLIISCWCGLAALSFIFIFVLVMVRYLMQSQLAGFVAAMLVALPMSVFLGVKLVQKLKQFYADWTLPEDELVL